MIKELVLKTYNPQTQDKPGLDKSFIELEFYPTIVELKEGDLISADMRNGQTLSVKGFENMIAKCAIVTQDKKEWFNQKYLQEGTVFYKIDW